MAISYSGIVGYGKFNLPSVESWGTNNNILKDPPRSITTRRRDKVGLNSALTQEIEMSHDRVAEVIKAYPRGVNPMVGVSYNGAGNAGIHGGQGSGQQAKLPYRVAMAGAFRPPILAPVDLLPLSRMPRLITKVNCTVNKPDFQKKLSCAAEKNTYRYKLLNTTCAAKSLYNIKKPIEIIDRRHLNTRKNAIAQDILSKKCAPSKGERSHIGAAKLERRQPVAEALHLNTSNKIHFAGEIPGMDVARHIAPSLDGSYDAPISGSRRENTEDLAALNYERYISDPLKGSMKANHSGKRKEQTSDLASRDYSRIIVRPLNYAAETSKNGPKIGYDGPQMGASAACRQEAFKAEIGPVQVIERSNGAQERPEYSRAFGRTGILVPED